MMTLAEFADRAVGVPWTPFGRSFEGWDCWGLVTLAYVNVSGIRLPHYVGEYCEPEDRGEIHMLIRSQMPSWRKVSEPTPMVVVLLRIGDNHCHVGLALGRGRMLHVEKGIETSVERLNGPRWSKRIVGFYTYDG